MHPDPLGSTWLVTEEKTSAIHAGIRFTQGQVLQRFAYGPFGATRFLLNPNGGAPTPAHAALLTTPAYTGHRALPGVGLVHAPARALDPTWGRFLTPDPVVADPTDAQAYNRYAYARNNPFRYTDPTGHFETEDAFGPTPDGVPDAIDPTGVADESVSAADNLVAATTGSSADSRVVAQVELPDGQTMTVVANQRATVATIFTWDLVQAAHQRATQPTHTDPQRGFTVQLGVSVSGGGGGGGQLGGGLVFGYSTEQGAQFGVYGMAGVGAFGGASGSVNLDVTGSTNRNIHDLAGQTGTVGGGVVVSPTGVGVGIGGGFEANISSDPNTTSSYTVSVGVGGGIPVEEHAFVTHTWVYGY